MLNISPIRAFEDNYIWLLQNSMYAAVIDPGDASPVIQLIEQQGLVLDSILITHHHNDHIGGVQPLIDRYHPTVYAPANGIYEFQHLPVKQGDLISLNKLDRQFNVIEIPGHTLDHVAYYGSNSLFCGDTLFGAGCGRLFEGTAEQMFNSLQKLATLPAETQIYCAHEYTQRNLEFAKMVAPDDWAISQRLREVSVCRAQECLSLPSTVALELATNPFLRCHESVFATVAQIKNPSPIEIFSALRTLRNHF